MTEHANAHDCEDCGPRCRHPNHHLDDNTFEDLLTWLLDVEMDRRVPQWAEMSCIRTSDGAIHCQIDGKPLIL